MPPWNGRAILQVILSEGRARPEQSEGQRPKSKDLRSRWSAPGQDPPLVILGMTESSTRSDGTLMPTPYKPDGYTSVAPYLTVDGAQATIDFLALVVGAVELRRHDGEGGKIAHAEVRIDDTVLMLADSMPQWPATSTNVHIYVPDVDATYAKAISAGAVSVQAPVQKGDPDRRCGVRDAGGTTWWFATMVG